MAKPKKIKHRISRRVKPQTVWQSLNEPISEPTPEFTKSFFSVALFLFVMLWLAPHWGEASQVHAHAPNRNVEIGYHASMFFDSEPAVFTARPSLKYGIYSTGRSASHSKVAGKTTSKGNESAELRMYYDIAPGTLVAEMYNTYDKYYIRPVFAASQQLFDMGDAWAFYKEFYGPGFSVMWNVWTDLLTEPANYNYLVRSK